MNSHQPPTDEEWETFDFDGEDELPRQQTFRHFAPTTYKDGGMIDWLREEAGERDRQRKLRSHEGLRGFLIPFMDSARMWVVIIATGIGVGLAGAWLDVLVKWLSDLREGRCVYNFFYNQPLCCTGLDSTETCRDWQSWAHFLNVRSILGHALIQSFMYIALAIAFAATAAVLVKTYAPYAFHTGIPEIKAILNGYVLDAFLSPWTLLIKALGLALAVASGLSLGKEGPLVHVACCMAYLFSRMFKQFRHNEAQKRKLLAAAAAAGVSVAFGSPLGGVLFGLEELDTFSGESDTMWRGFVTSVVAAVSLQYVDPFGTAKLVLFEVNSISDTWRAFELVPWIMLGVIGGALGSLLIKLNVSAAMYRRYSVINDWPILEVVCATAVTAAVSYMVVFARVQSVELVSNLFQDCDPNRGDYHGLCNPAAMWENVFLLIVTALMKVGLTAWTFGMMIPAGIFLPTITIGACLGRAVGLLVQGFHRAYPTSWIFAACPPDPTVRCISPGFYAVIGASAMLGGVTRMTISLVVILFELTGALSHVLPIMISVMAAKWTGDAFGRDGIYSAWIAMRRYPWLPPVDYRDGGEGETAEKFMKPANSLICLEEGEMTVTELEHLVRTHQVQGFPVVQRQYLIGYITRDKLKLALDALASNSKTFPPTNSRCTFSPAGRQQDRQSHFYPPSQLYSDPTPQPQPPLDPRSRASGTTDLSDLLEETAMQLRKEVPQQLVVGLFQKMNLSYLLFTHEGRLTGMTTREDIVALLKCHVSYSGALAPGVGDNVSDGQTEGNEGDWEAGRNSTTQR